MPVGARRWHQGGNAVDQLQWCEGELVCPDSSVIDATLVSALITARLAVLLGAAVHQVLTYFAQALHRKRRTRAVAQQPLQASAVVRFDAHAGVHREAAVPVGQHVFGLKALQQAPAHEGAQDAAAQGGLHLGHGGLIDCTGRVENHFAG